VLAIAAELRHRGLAGTAALTPNLREPHAGQLPFIQSPAKRKIVRAGRRGGKTSGVAIPAVKAFCAGHRVLYATPTAEQIDRFWFEVKRALRKDLDAGRLYKNETEHVIEVPDTEQRIRAKTAWNADTLRGDYADLLILDEWQLMNEDTWGQVGAPMLLDNNGDAIFLYTPPSLHSRSVSKAHDPLHAAKLFKRALADPTGRWAAFHFSSHMNPHISAEALAEITQDMTALAVRQEIDAEDTEEAPGALWKMAALDKLRMTSTPDFQRAATGIDPSATSTGNEAGIITGGVGMCRCKGTPELHAFVVSDSSLQGSPSEWAGAAVTAYNVHHCDRLVAESNNGGEMVAITIGTIKDAPSVKLVHASRGKATRAEPIAALYEQGKVHHVGTFAALESEMTQWTPGDASPNRLDALVWVLTELMLGGGIGDWESVAGLGRIDDFESRWK